MRNQFTFYRSFWEAISGLPSKTKLTVIEAVCEYALDNQEPQLSGVAKTVFLLIKPTLDTSARRSESGRAGGAKQSASKREANEKQTAREKEGENEIEKESLDSFSIEKESAALAPSRHDGGGAARRYGTYDPEAHKRPIVYKEFGSG